MQGINRDYYENPQNAVTGLSIRHADGSFTKLQDNTWYKETDHGRIISPIKEKSIVTPLTSIVMMVSALSTGCILSEAFGIAPLICSGTILAASTLVQYNNTAFLSPEDKKNIGTSLV